VMILESFGNDICRILVIVSIPLLLAAIVSMSVSILQAATQLQDQMSAFLIRMAVYGIGLVYCGPVAWRGITQFTVLCFRSASVMARQG
jgi:type III secretory pathway component EscS